MLYDDVEWCDGTFHLEVRLYEKKRQEVVHVNENKIKIGREGISEFVTELGRGEHVAQEI